MDKAKILDFLKKNVFALLCGVVAIAAVVGAFYPFSGYVQQLRDRSAQEAGNYGTITGFTRPRHFPLVDPTRTTPVDLPAFPNATQVKVGKDAVDTLGKQSERALDLVVALNDTTVVHPLLVPEALPAPVSDTPKFLFVDVYKKVLSTDPAMSGHSSPAVPPPIQANPSAPVPMTADERLAAVHAENLFNDVLHAGQPADPKLVEARRLWLRDNVYAPQIIGDINGQPTNREDVDRRYAAEAKDVPDKLAHEIADTKQVYLDAGAFAVQPSILSNGNPQLADIWFAQLSFWMQRDMAEAVAAANADSKAVATSPVKRILGLSLMPVPMYLFPTAAGTAAAPSPATDVQPLPAMYSRSPTGRVSNGMYDVVPFRLTVDVEVGQVNRFIETLTKDRLIYVANQDLYALDATTLVPAGYLYGSKPVVRLTLTGEELFLRKWTTPIMPIVIKVRLGLMAAPPGMNLGGTTPTFAAPMGAPPGMDQSGN